MTPTTPVKDATTNLVGMTSTWPDKARVNEEGASPDPAETLLEAAARASDSRLTAPWRFMAIAGDARFDLASAVVRAQIRRLRTSIEHIQATARAMVLSAPLIIVVGVDSDLDQRVVEDVCAGAAAIQSMLTAAHDLGLAALWHTGDACAAVEVKQLLGLPASSLVLGFIYIGAPSSRVLGGRPSDSDLTTWLVSSARPVKHAAGF